jgi:hypothetical protein
MGRQRRPIKSKISQISFFPLAPMIPVKALMKILKGFLIGF